MATECSTHIVSESNCKLIHFAMHLNLMVLILQVLSDAMWMKGLKKINLDPIKKNYSPVSNLAFLGKVIEKSTSKQIINHITRNDFMEEIQLAYRGNHSTKPAAFKVKSDILKSMDNQEVTGLILLDLSAAFDTVDHNLLIQCLHTNFAIRNKALDWVESYLNDHRK